MLFTAAATSSFSATRRCVRSRCTSAWVNSDSSQWSRHKDGVPGWDPSVDTPASPHTSLARVTASAHQSCWEAFRGTGLGSASDGLG